MCCSGVEGGGEGIGRFTTLKTSPPNSKTVTEILQNTYGTLFDIDAGRENITGMDILISGCFQITAATAGVINVGVGVFDEVVAAVKPVTPLITTVTPMLIPISFVVPAGYWWYFSSGGDFTFAVGEASAYIATPL